MTVDVVWPYAEAWGWTPETVDKITVAEHRWYRFRFEQKAMKQKLAAQKRGRRGA